MCYTISSNTNQEKKLQAIDYRIDGQYWIPVLAQNIEANVALEVDVGVIHLGAAFDLRRLMRVVGADAEVEHETAVPVEALIGRDD